MSDRVVTELVIDSDTAGADVFSQGMDKAGKSAADAGTSIASMSLAVAGVSVAVVGGLTALRSYIDYVGKQSQSLVDMADHAELAGLSVREFQQSLFAARAAGLTEKDFVSGLDKISDDLTRAGQGVTQFGKLFEVNGVSIRQQNGELKTAKQALSDIMGLMKEASPTVARELARIVGLSNDWIPFLRQGEEAFERQKQAAAGLGVIIDDGMVARAKEFNTEWKIAVASWDLQFKASLASIMPLLIKLAEGATWIIDKIGSVSSTMIGAMTPDEDKNASLLNDKINRLYELRERMQAFGGAEAERDTYGRLKDLRRSLGLPEDADLEAVDQMREKLQGLYDDKVRAQARVNIYGDTKLPPGAGEDRNALDRTIDQLEKRIAVTKADTEAVGQSEAAHAGLRAEAELYAAAERAGITDLEKYANKFYDLRERIEQSTAAFKKAQLANDIRFGRDTALLSPQDAQIASQLRGQYKSVEEALNSADAAQLRFNATMKEGWQSFQSAGASALTDWEMGLKSGGDALKAFEQQFLRSMLNMANNQIFGMIGRFLSGGVSGFSVLPGVSSAHGNVFAGGDVVPFAQGGIVNGPTLAPMALMGEAGPEAVVPLKRGRDGNLGIAGGGGGSTHITYQIDASGADSGTVERIKAVLEQHGKSIAGQAKALTSRQRFEQYGVS